MGCDIHLYVEFLHEDGSWKSLAGEFNLDRSYAIFGRLAGVRGGVALVPPRGVPEDLSPEVASEYWVRIENGAGAAIMVEKGQCVYRDEKKTHVSDSNWHSASWLPGQIFRNAIYPSQSPDYLAVLAILDFFSTKNVSSRVVFWFDN